MTFTTFASNTDRVPPNCIDIEEILLGQILMDERIVPLVVAVLDTSHFYSAQSRIFYDAIAALHKKKLPANLHTVSRYLQENGHGEEIRTRLGNLVGSWISSAGCLEHAQMIKEKFQLRQIIAIGDRMISDAYGAITTKIDSDEIIDEYGTELIKLRQENVVKKVQAVGDLVPTVFSELEKSNCGQDAIAPSIPIGFTDIDYITGGMPKDALTVVGGRGGMGKSTFGLNIALRRAESGDTVLYFALEMSNSQMIRKSLANLANKDTGNLAVGKLFRVNEVDADDWGAIADAGLKLTGLDLWLQDDSSITIPRIRADIQQVLAYRKKVDLVVIDYIQLIQPDKYDRKQNRVLELDSILRSLRIIAKDFQCAVLGLAQLSRAAEGRADKRPMPSDFRESGAFEQEAAVLLGLYREEYYDKQTTEKGILELSALKSRFSDIGTTKILFDSAYGIFRDNPVPQYQPQN